MNCAITGYGVVSRVGIGSRDFERGMQGEPLAFVRAADAGYEADTFVAPASNFDPKVYLGEKGLRSLDQQTKLVLAASRLALHDSGLKQDEAWRNGDAEKTGFILSTAYPSLEAIHELVRVFLLEEPRYINPNQFPNTVSNTPAGYASIWEGYRALNATVSNGNTGGIDALCLAESFLATGRAKAIVVGGADSLSPALVAGIGLTGTKITAGEGAALLALEPEIDAVARGAEPLATILGFGSSTSFTEENSTVHLSRNALSAAIELALADAGVSVNDIDLVVSGIGAHKKADVVELDAIDAHLPNAPIAAPKRYLGETFGAAGTFAIASALAWREGVPAAAMLRGGNSKPRMLLITSLGLYGNATACVVRLNARES
jgi:3-oxoacyl-[acyl-carrier-protein] synthase II